MSRHFDPSDLPFVGDTGAEIGYIGTLSAFRRELDGKARDGGANFSDVQRAKDAETATHEYEAHLFCDPKQKSADASELCPYVGSMSTKPNITEQSKTLFLAYANDAGNWSGTPMVGGNVGRAAADKGNLTQLKQAGLLTTFNSDGCMFVDFTKEGIEFATSEGVDLSFID